MKNFVTLPLIAALAVATLFCLAEPPAARAGNCVAVSSVHSFGVNSYNASAVQTFAVPLAVPVATVQQFAVTNVPVTTFSTSAYDPCVNSVQAVQVLGVPVVQQQVFIRQRAFAVHAYPHVVRTRTVTRVQTRRSGGLRSGGLLGRLFGRR